MVSISPVPKLLPGPVSYFHRLWSMPVPDAPLKSSLQVSEKPDGGAGAATAVSVVAVTVAATVSATTGSNESALFHARRIGRALRDVMYAAWRSVACSTRRWTHSASNSATTFTF